MPDSRGSSRSGDARQLAGFADRPARAETSDSDTSSSDVDTSDLEAMRKHRVPLWAAILGTGMAAALSSCATFALTSSPTGPSTGASQLLSTMQDANALDRETERGACVPGKHHFEEISTFDPWAQNAVFRAFHLVNHARKRCPNGGLPSLPFGKSAFLSGNDKCHTVQVHHKYSKSCGSETYKLDFRIACDETDQSNGTSFTVHVNRDRDTEHWVLLQSRPTVCDVNMGSTASPRVMSADSNETRAVADFAALELGFAMEREGCLPAGTDGFNVSRVLRATAVVVDGVAWHMILELIGADGAAAKQVSVTVLERCAEGTPCIRQLSVPGGDVCGVFKATPATERRLGAGARADEGAYAADIGAVDPTDIVDAQRQWLRNPRRLQSQGRKPLTVRQLRDTPISLIHDKAADDCLLHIPPFNQGHCASCYAAATAQMIGIRKCLLDKREGARRLSTLRGSTLRGVRGQNDTLRNLPIPFMRALNNFPCQDDSQWKVTGKGKTVTCAWFATHDLGCRKFPDHGQLSHCRATCGTCGAGGLKRTRQGAYFQYMPSLNDVATCARDSEGRVRGCNGGGPEDVWNNWMKDEKRDLWIHGVRCMPNMLKCHEASDGVTNPLSAGGDCKQFNQFPVWQRPCWCISRKQIPESATCSRKTPPRNCRHEVPPAMFIIKSVAHGLSPREASENMQRHIQEYGPIIVAVLVTNEFRKWDWTARPVYTGGSETLGGHVMLATGWGNLGGTDFWQLRNSWGESWGNGGYCKFQRGINLDTIEERGVAASMPEANFHDFAEPVCAFKGIRWMWYKMGDGTVTNYTGFVDYGCDKDCRLDVHFSERSTDPDSAANGGLQLNQQVQSGRTATFRLNLLTLGFGMEVGNMYLNAKALDASGNAAETHGSVRIPPAGS